MVKYSFIVPVYNCEAYLKDCVESLLGQTGSYSFEIILVDDGAKDRSGQIAEELAGIYPKVRAFHKENGGAASARNYGLEKAEGEYILFIDGDDTVDAALLESVEPLLTDFPQSLVVYGMSFDYYKGEELRRTEHLSCGHKGCFAVESVLENFPEFFWDNALSSACNRVFSGEVIRRNGLRFAEGMTLYEDLDFVLRYLIHSEKICCIDRAFYHYRHDLAKPHLNHRVRDLAGVRRNMARLLNTASELAATCDGVSAGGIQSTIANLYMQMLSQNLMARGYSLAEMEAALTDYCSEESFRKLLGNGAELSGAEQRLLDRINAGEFRDIQREYSKRKLISKGKRAVKKLLGRQ